MDLNFFNPKSQKEQDFLINFVARQNTLNFFLQQLRLTVANQPARHILVVAPRGYGKTSLLRRISIAVRSEAEFSDRFIALTFREEQHNIISLDVFWRNCLVALQEAREDEGAPAEEIDQLEKLWEKYPPRSTLKREEQDGEPAWQAFQAHCKQLGRRPILLIDNLDSLLTGLVDQHQWALRRILQRDDSPVLMAAASRYPESTHDGKAAFYDFFSIQTLARLSDDEVMQCLRTLAMHRGEKGKKVINLLNNDPGRISALNTLAGGNPRTLNVLYSVLEADMSADILSQLSAMLDTFTGWYQARTEEIPPQSRAVFDALALNWNPIKAADLSLITGLDTPTVSSHLSKLEKTGYAEAVSLSTKGKGRNGYQVSERFYNIWYLMRNGPRRAQKEIKFLTAFLQSCFSVSERRTMAQNILGADCAEPGYALALASSIGLGGLRNELIEHVQKNISRSADSSEYADFIKSLKDVEQPKLNDKKNIISAASIATYRAYKFCDEGKYKEAEDTYLAALDNNPEDARLHVSYGDLLGSYLKRYADAEIEYRKAITLNPRVAKSYSALAKLLQKQKIRFDEAEINYRQAITLSPEDPELYIDLGMMLQFDLNKYDESEVAYRNAISINPKNGFPYLILGSLFQYYLNRYDEAEKLYLKVIDIGSPNGMVWIFLGNLYLDKKANIQKALEAYSQGLLVGKDEVELHLNYSYALALFENDLVTAGVHAAKALKNKQVSPSGRYLLGAIPRANVTNEMAFEHLWHQVNLAVNCEDSNLWVVYQDDLQRLLWYVIVNNHGTWFKEKMEAAQYPVQFAPLYVAFKAALEGEDVLLQINPETRQPAQRIYDGLAHLLKIYPKSTRK